MYSLVISALLLFPQTCAQSARQALSVWGLQVVPSLFPYMVVSKMLANQIKRTAFPPAAACMLLGALGGSPSGAAAVYACRSRLTRKSILALAAFSGTISPMFFLGTLKEWIGNPIFSRILFISHIGAAAFSAVCVYLLPLRPEKINQETALNTPSGSPLSESIDAILQVGGCIICCSVAAGFLNLLPLSRKMMPVIHALLEISGGIHALCMSAISLPLKEILLAFTSGFGGISILSQNLIFLKPLGLHPWLLVILAILRGFFSVLTLLLIRCI